MTRFTLSGRLFFAGILWVTALAWGNDEPQVVRQVPCGMLCKLDGVRNLLVLEGTPEEMGKAHGQLMKNEIELMYRRILLVATGYAVSQNQWFFDRIAEAGQRTKPFVPARFYDEMNALAKSSGITSDEVAQINTFPELFHCSGLAVCGRATIDGKIRHVRVLDYMKQIGLQKFATLIVYCPKGLNAWASVSYPGFIGSVTAMNTKGLAMGEMGGRGEGKWDGLPMSLLIRRVMEECETVEQAITLMKSVPLTCDYYYILSDRQRHMAAIEAIAGAKNPVVVYGPGQSDSRLPGGLADTVYISAPGIHADTLYQRLKEYHGRIDSTILREIIKRPVARDSNLHNAIFEPETLDLWFAEAGTGSVACDERYFHVNLADILKFFNREKQKSTGSEEILFDEPNSPGSDPVKKNH